MKKKLLIETGGLLHRPVLKEEENSSGKKWTASVWQLDKRNLNGRTYSTELAERIVKENPVTIAYDGHSVDCQTGQEYGITKAVCSNPRIEDGCLRVDIDFIDKEFEALVSSLTDRGVPIGVSSVGYGIEDEQGVIDPGSYVLIRFLDFVTTPAGEVYVRVESEDPEKPGKSGESVDKPDADKALAERRAKVAGEIKKLLLGE